MLLGRGLESLLLDGDSAVGPAYCHRIGVRRAHHHALYHRLPADQEILGALEQRNKRQARHASQVFTGLSSKGTHESGSLDPSSTGCPASSPSLRLAEATVCLELGPAWIRCAVRGRVSTVPIQSEDTR